MHSSCGTLSHMLRETLQKRKERFIVMNESTFQAGLPRIDSMSLPPDVRGLFRTLGLKEDSVGLGLFGDLKLPERSDEGNFRAQPRIYATDVAYVLADLFHHESHSIFPMNLRQASSFIVSEVREPYSIGPYTIWIPFADANNLQGILRLYKRGDETVELFIYSSTDPSNWAFGEDYVVAYHQG